MKVYLASTCEDKSRMRDVATMLQQLGYTIVSSWIHRPHATDTNDPASECVWAVRRENEVKACDRFVIFSDAPVRRQGRGARHTELGMARVLGKRIVAVGEPEQLFHYVPGITWVPDTAELIQYLADCQYLAWLER